MSLKTKIFILKMESDILRNEDKGSSSQKRSEQSFKMASFGQQDVQYEDLIHSKFPNSIYIQKKDTTNSNFLGINNLQLENDIGIQLEQINNMKYQVIKILQIGLQYDIPQILQMVQVVNIPQQIQYFQNQGTKSFETNLVSKKISDNLMDFIFQDFQQQLQFNIYFIIFLYELYTTRVSIFGGTKKTIEESNKIIPPLFKTFSNLRLQSSNLFNSKFVGLQIKFTQLIQRFDEQQIIFNGTGNNILQQYYFSKTLNWDQDVELKNIELLKQIIGILQQFVQNYYDDDFIENNFPSN